MKTMIMFIIALSLALGLALPAAAKPVQTQCPIMGYTPNKELHVDYKGKRIFFCCASCPEKFKQDPEKYMRELKRKGVPLEDAPGQPAQAPIQHNE